MAADLIVSFAVKIGEFVFVPIGESVSYLCDYNKNLISFQTRVLALENTKTEIQDLVDEAQRNGEHILPQVAEWLTSADGMVDESRNFLGEQQGSPSCSNIVSRYRISKKAKKRMLDVNKLLEDGKFDRVSRQVPPPLWSVSTGDVETFDSRNLTFKAIMDALKDDTINVIGVYGMGGVGKTTLVKEVAKQAGEQKLFDEMVMSVISQTMNVRNIQGEIADKLGLKLEQESESGRATRLCERLKQSTSVLLILDDVWRLLDLGAIGIPHNDVHKGCKLLLTSRSKDVCYEMNAQVCVSVNVLSELDAWNLFSKMANITHNSDVHMLATKVAKRCAGLPIAVVTVARALRGKSKHAWSDALGQLQSPPPRNIKSMQKYVYSSLELSYNFLETDEIKSCFLLCSLFKEDVEIPIEILVRYGMGLRLFQNVYKLEAARDRAYALVESLKACCLLLDGKNEEYVRMHDVIRDFAILVASSGQTMSLVKHDVQSFGGHTGEPLTPFAAVSLASTNIAELPGGLACPKLEVLLLQFHSDSIQIPGNFFEGMKELKVVSMSDMPILSLPWSVKSLWKMRTLCLERCKLRDMSSIGELKSLEILSFVGSNVKRLPEEVGQLTRLRLLDLTDCEELTTIPPNVLSKLTSLESLNMMNSFVNWSGEDKVDMQGNNTSLTELKMLSCLRSLEVNILDVSLIPRDLLLENLIKFKIYVGSYWLVSLTHRYSTALKLRIDEGTISLPHCITLLLKQAQYLILEYCPQVLKNVLYNMRREHFQNLRGLVLYGNSDIECIVDTIICKPGALFLSLEKLEVVSMENLKEICHGHLPTTSFSALQELDLKYLPEFVCLWKEGMEGDICLVNLRNVSVHTCHKLKIIFPLHTATDRGLLRYLCIFNCEILRGIFSDNIAISGDEVGEIVLPMLKTLELSLLPQLKTFCPTLNEISSSDDSHDMPLFGGNVKFPELQELILRELPRVKSLWHQQVPEESFGRLKVLRITRCNAISKLIPFNMVQRLNNFESLSIINCDMVKEVFELEGLGDETSAKLVNLPPLKELVLCGLSELNHLWWNKGSFGYVSLQFLCLLTITRCDSLIYIFSLSALKGLSQLQRLEIESCALVKEIVSFEIREDSNMVVFPQLHALRLNHLPDLTSFYKDHKAFDWPSLKILTIANCPKLKTFPASQCEQIADHVGNLSATVPPLFNEKVAFPNTEELHIQYMENLVEVWHHKLPDQTFSSLQLLDVRGCERLLDVGPTHMLPRLQMLSKLYIEDCGSVKEIFVTKPALNQEDSYVSLLSLTELRLKSLPKLKHIWWNKDSRCESPHFPNLTSLEVSGCDHLKYILSTSIMKGLAQLQELRISSCELVEEVVLKDISVEDQVKVVFLPRMKTLELKSLPNLRSFCSIYGTLQLPSLQVLKVTNCPMMKMFASFQNHTNLRFGDPASDVFFGGEILLPVLEKLSFEGLSNSAGLWHNQLPCDSFHQLKKLKVKKCKNLTRLVPELKDLKNLYVEECDSLEEILVMGQSIKGSHENHLVCTLRDVTLRNLPKLVEIWWNRDLNGTLKYSMFSLLKVIKCDGLRKVFSVSVMKHFPHLEELHLADCLIMKQVVAYDEGKEYVGTNVVFPQLHTLRFVNLPNLTSFCEGLFIVEFPSLEYLNLEACPDMRIFSLGPLVTPKLNAIALENGEQLWKDDLNSTIKHLFMAKPPTDRNPSVSELALVTSSRLHAVGSDGPNSQ